MKKLLLSAFLFLCAILYIEAQPVIELTGKGVAGETSSTLHFDDIASIDKVEVEVMAVFRNNQTPASIQLSDSDENFTAEFMLAEHDYAPTIHNGTDQHWGYYTATFNTIDGGGITLNKNTQNDEVISYIAYVYRTNDNPELYSEVIYDHAFIFRNGVEEPFIYEFTLPESSGSRDFVLKLPLSDIASGYTPRYAVVSLTAGMVSETAEYSENNMGDYLHIAELILKDVPGDVTKVYASIYSPLPEEKLGDSFLTGAALLTISEKAGCTLTQGYWKTHSVYGPAKKADATWELIGPDTEFFLSGNSYYEVINTPPARGNAYYNLAQQYIATELNLLAGAGSSEIIDEFEEATELFNTYSPSYIGGLRPTDPIIKKFKKIAAILDKYNNGLIGPGHCDNEYDDIQSYDIPISLDASVNPNPVKNNANINFIPVANGRAKVELFDLMGNKKESLFDSNVFKAVPVGLKLNAKPYKEGSYILIITNGSSKESLKIRITN